MHSELWITYFTIEITIVILLPEKFLPFDWLRAEVFQLNLKYLHVKITVTMVTQNHQIISSHELRKNGGKISRFWNQEIQELKENSENQNTEKSTSTWLNVWTTWAENKNFKTNLLADDTKQLDKNKHMALNDWISQVVYKQLIAWIVRDIWHKYHMWYFKIAPNYVRQFWNNTRGIYAKYHYKITLLPIHILAVIKT